MTKPATVWRPQQPGSVTTANQGVLRVTQASVQRTTQAGVSRVLNDSVSVNKPATEWSE